MEFFYLFYRFSRWGWTRETGAKLNFTLIKAVILPSSPWPDVDFSFLMCKTISFFNNVFPFLVICDLRAKFGFSFVFLQFVWTFEFPCYVIFAFVQCHFLAMFCQRVFLHLNFPELYFFVSVVIIRVRNLIICKGVMVMGFSPLLTKDCPNFAL